MVKDDKIKCTGKGILEYINEVHHEYGMDCTLEDLKKTLKEIKDLPPRDEPNFAEGYKMASYMFTCSDEDFIRLYNSPSTFVVTGSNGLKRIEDRAKKLGVYEDRKSSNKR